MEPITGISLFTTVVGLICNWKQEHDAHESDQFNSFMVWLTNHNFQSLRERIFESDELQRDLHSLLASDFNSMSKKLDVVCEAVSAIAGKIDGLAEVGTRFAAVSDRLSNQACELLCRLDEIKSGQMHYENSPYEVTIAFLPIGSGAFEPEEPRFVHTDIEVLMSLGWIALASRGSGGDPILQITRTGSRAAKVFSSARTDDFPLK